MEMAAGWKQDFPNVERYYVFQIWPNSCAMGGRNGSGDMLREKQRQLPELFSNMSILSTLGVQPEGGCHFPLEGWGKFARMVLPLIERDFYGNIPNGPISSPNLRRATYHPSHESIDLEFDQPVVWQESIAGEFYLDGQRAKILSGNVSGNTLTLKSQSRLLMGENGLAALTFCNVSIDDQVRN
jgi:hypothetical protein